MLAESPHIRNPEVLPSDTVNGRFPLTVTLVEDVESDPLNTVEPPCVTVMLLPEMLDEKPTVKLEKGTGWVIWQDALLPLMDTLTTPLLCEAVVLAATVTVTLVVPADPDDILVLTQLDLAKVHAPVAVTERVKLDPLPAAV